MGKPGRPRFGSMGVWPRVRAKKVVARVRAVKSESKPKLLAFPTYKAGMTHIMITGGEKGKRIFGQTAAIPATILECPPIRIASVRLYKKKGTGIVVDKQLNFKPDKDLARRLVLPKKDAKYSTSADVEKINPDDYANVTVQVYTLPRQIELKKTPDILEIHIGGSVKEKLDYVKEHAEKPIPITDVLREGQFVDVHAVTKGKGFQGALKRFGIGLKGHKSEKARRTPGSLGGWKGQAHVMYRVAHAGQMGYHMRTQYNNLVMKIGDKPEEVNPDGGFVNYGNVKSNYIIIKGSIAGAKKRLITLTEPIRQKVKPVFSSESIKIISTTSRQRR